MIVKLSPEPFMLNHIGQQNCRIVALSRCLVVKCRMATLKVVGVDILSDGNSGFLDTIVSDKLLHT